MVTLHIHYFDDVKDERTNQNIERALRKYVNEAHDDWDLHLDAVVYSLNTLVQVDIHSIFCCLYFLITFC